MANIYRVLEAEHRAIAGLVDELEARPGPDAEGRRLLLDRLIAASSRHEAAEELAFWPEVGRRAQDGRSLRDEGLRQEGDARAVLDALRFETGDAAFRSGITEVAALVRAHIEFEEERVWPALRHATGPIGARLSGARYALAARMTPTRPHPNGPQRALGLATVGAATAAVDRMRDRLGGRRRDVVAPARRAVAAGTEDAADAPVDAADFILGEHRRIDGLLVELERRGPGDAGLVARIVKELSVHDAIERQHLYPVVRHRLQAGNDLYAHSISEHGRVATLLAVVDRRPPGDAHRDELLGRLPTLVRTHVAEEETEILPALRLHLADEELRMLGARLAAARHGAPTRPHAHAAGAGFGARVSRLVAGPLDRTRDALAGRR